MKKGINRYLVENFYGVSIIVLPTLDIYKRRFMLCQSIHTGQL